MESGGSSRQRSIADLFGSNAIANKEIEGSITSIEDDQVSIR